MCAALASRRQGAHSGGVDRGGAAAGPDDRQRRRAARRREELRPHSRVPARQQPARDDRTDGARQDADRDHHQRHQGAAGVPGRGGGVRRVRREPDASPPRRRARRSSATATCSSSAPVGTAPSRSTTPTAPGGWSPRRWAAAGRDAGSTTRRIASLDLVRRYGDDWERPLSCSRAGRELDPARLPRRRARRRPARRLPRAGAFPRTPGDASPPRAGMSSDSRRAPGRDHRPGRRPLRRADAAAVPADRADRPLARARRSGSWLGAGALGHPAARHRARARRVRAAGHARHEALGVSDRRPERAAALSRRRARARRPVFDIDDRPVPGQAGGRASRLLRGRRFRSGIGVAGAVLVGFLALSALTLATFAWHPLQRLERQPEAPARGQGRDREGRGQAARRRRDAGQGRRRSAGRAAEMAKARDEPKTAPKPDGKPSKAKAGEEAGAAPRARASKDLGPGLGGRAARGAAHQEASTPARASSTSLQERLEETLAEFKVEGDVAGRTTGPVVTQYGVRLRPGVKMNRLVDLADDLALKMSARSIRVARIPGPGHGGSRGARTPSRAWSCLRELLEDDAVGGRGAAAAGRAGPRSRGPAGHRRPGQDAAPAHRGRDRHRQVGRDQRDHHVAHLPLPAQGGPAPPDDRPEDGGAVDVQGPAPPPPSGRHQQQGGRAGAQVGRRRDGAALRAARGQRRAQHDRLQPQGARRASRSGIRRRDA